MVPVLNFGKERVDPVWHLALVSRHCERTSEVLSSEPLKRGRPRSEGHV